MQDNILGENVKTSRIQKGYSQEKLAELLDITPTHVKHIESGHRKPSVDLLFAMARKLDMALDPIVFHDVTPREELLHRMNILLKDSNEKQLDLICRLAAVVVDSD